MQWKTKTEQMQAKQLKQSYNRNGTVKTKTEQMSAEELKRNYSGNGPIKKRAVNGT